MADPRQLAVKDRKQVLSPLMQAKAQATTGEKVNACPFGCSQEDIDENGYCDHLVGFTNDRKTFEPMVKDPLTGRRVVKVQKDADGKPRLQPVLKTDDLVQITVSWRVYRKVESLPKSA